MYGVVRRPDTLIMIPIVTSAFNTDPTSSVAVDWNCTRKSVGSLESFRSDDDDALAVPLHLPFCQFPRFLPRQRETCPLTHSLTPIPPRSSAAPTDGRWT